MVRWTTVSSCLVWAAGLCGLYGSFAGAVVVANPKNGSSSSTSRVNVGNHGNGNVGDAGLRSDGLETSQTTRVDQVDRPSPPDHYNRNSADRVSGKDYDGVGGGGYPVRNTYGPPRDYYQDERPEYYGGGSNQVGSGGGGSYQVGGGGHPVHDGEVVYHHHQYPPYAPDPHPVHQQVHHGGEGHGEFNVQPILWPLAGITLLGVLSALVKTPLLLHLGHINYAGRRRRDVNGYYNSQPITAETIKSIMDKFNDKERRRIGPQECLVCNVVASIYDRTSTCFERSVCEVMSRHKPGETETDRRPLTAMIAQVIRNDQIPEDFKERLGSAETNGRNGANCGRLYPCGENLHHHGHHGHRW